MKHETLYHAVAILDRYLAKEKVTKENLQLVGGVAFALSSKLHVSHPFIISTILHEYDFRM